MKAAVRAFVVFIGLLLLGGATFLFAAIYELVPGLSVEFPGWAGKTVVVAIGASLVLLAVIIISFGLRTGPKIANAVLKGSEYGEILISITAIENMVLRVVQQTEGIKDVGRQVSFTQNGLQARVKIKVMPDMPLPELTGELQAKIKSYLEEITGITVHDIKVMVENIIVEQAVTRK